MEKFEFKHSLKNIPIPTKDNYLKTLFAKTGDFVERLRWKVFFYLNPKAKQENIETYGFNTAKTAPPINELKDFEDDLYKLVNKKLEGEKTYLCPFLLVGRIKSHNKFNFLYKMF